MTKLYATLNRQRQTAEICTIGVVLKRNMSEETIKLKTLWQNGFLYLYSTKNDVERSLMAQTEGIPGTNRWTNGKKRNFLSDINKNVDQLKIFIPCQKE